MEQRLLGRTGLRVSILGLGGFHLLEIPSEEAARLVALYLDSGGNYLETAASYGDGESELKIGRVVKRRRDECILATKTGARDKHGCLRSLDTSLKNLQTDHVDLLFAHSVATDQDVSEILGPEGMVEGFLQAKREGKARFLAISVHGHPGTLIRALKEYPFDAAMATLNYFDRCNFPELEKELVPLCVKNNTGLIAMKPLADGFLWRSVGSAMRYVWSFPGVAMIVAGANSREMLEEDISLAGEFLPMTGAEVSALLRDAEELGDYVCRQCEECPVCSRVPVRDVFRLEGYYDRQMRDGRPRTPPEFALRDRLRFWFQNREMARAAYARLGVDASTACDNCAGVCGTCPYGVDVKFKLRYAHYKLTGDVEAF